MSYSSIIDLSRFGLMVQLAVVIRGFWAKMWSVYPLFYFPLACSLIGGAATDRILSRHPALYFQWYWRLQIITMFLACGSLLEISRHVFKPGDFCARKFGKSIFYAVCALTAAGALFYFASLWNAPKTKAAAIALDIFERDFRVMQAGALLVLFAGVFYFGLPLSRNLKGISVGYGIYVGSSLLTLAIRALFRSAYNPTMVSQLGAYTLSLLIYLFCLWTYTPTGVPTPISNDVTAPNPGDGIRKAQLKATP